MCCLRGMNCNWSGKQGNSFGTYVEMIFLEEKKEWYRVQSPWNTCFCKQTKKSAKTRGTWAEEGGRGSGGELRAGRSGSRVGLQRARPVTTRNGSRRRRRTRRTRRRRSRAYPGSRSSTGPRAVLSTCWWSYDGPEDPRGRLMHQHQHQHQLHQQLRQWQCWKGIQLDCHRFPW